MSSQDNNEILRYFFQMLGEFRRAIASLCSFFLSQQDQHRGQDRASGGKEQKIRTGDKAEGIFSTKVCLSLADCSVFKICFSVLVAWLVLQELLHQILSMLSRLVALQTKVLCFTYYAKLTPTACQDSSLLVFLS